MAEPTIEMIRGAIKSLRDLFTTGEGWSVDELPDGTIQVLGKDGSLLIFEVQEAPGGGGVAVPIQGSETNTQLQGQQLPGLLFDKALGYIDPLTLKPATSEQISSALAKARAERTQSAAPAPQPTNFDFSLNKEGNAFRFNPATGSLEPVAGGKGFGFPTLDPSLTFDEQVREFELTFGLDKEIAAEAVRSNQERERNARDTTRLTARGQDINAALRQFEARAALIPEFGNIALREAEAIRVILSEGGDFLFRAGLQRGSKDGQIDLISQADLIHALDAEINTLRESIPDTFVPEPFVAEAAPSPAAPATVPEPEAPATEEPKKNVSGVPGGTNTSLVEEKLAERGLDLTDLPDFVRKHLGLPVLTAEEKQAKASEPPPAGTVKRDDGSADETAPNVSGPNKDGGLGTDGSTEADDKPSAGDFGFGPGFDDDFSTVDGSFATTPPLLGGTTADATERALGVSSLGGQGLGVPSVFDGFGSALSTIGSGLTSILSPDDLKRALSGPIGTAPLDALSSLGGLRSLLGGDSLQQAASGPIGTAPLGAAKNLFGFLKDFVTQTDGGRVEELQRQLLLGPIVDPLSSVFGFAAGGVTHATVFRAGDDPDGSVLDTEEIILNPTGAPLGIIPGKRVRDRKALPKFATGTFGFLDQPSNKLDLFASNFSSEQLQAFKNMSQAELQELSRTTAPQAIKTIRGGGQPNPLDFGFKPFTARQLLSLDEGELAALDTASRVEHQVPLSSIIGQTQRLFGASDTRPRSRTRGFGF